MAAVGFGLFDWVDRHEAPLGSSTRSGCACFAWGDLSVEQSLRSLRLFADEVMPAFRG